MPAINRHESANIAYPLIEVPEALQDETAGILDVYCVLFGDPDGQLSGLSGSSSAGDLAPRLELRTIATVGLVTTFNFRAYLDSYYWDIAFDVSHALGIGVVKVKDSSRDCVLIVDADQMFKGDSDIYLEAEPARAEFHRERLSSLAFYNIYRAGETEDPDTLLHVATYDADGEIPLQDGYNTFVSYDGELAILGEAGGGLGAAPDYGDTALASGSSTAFPADFVSVINGLLPRDGQIAVDVSSGLGLEAGEGYLRIVKKL